MKTDLLSWNKAFEDLDDFWGLSRKSTIREYEYDSQTKTLMVDMPGIRKEDITINVDKNLLTVEGKTGNRQYKNTYTIKYKFNEESITAKSLDGVLYISIPEDKERGLKKIAIE